MTIALALHLIIFALQLVILVKVKIMTRKSQERLDRAKQYWDAIISKNNQN